MCAMGPWTTVVCVQGDFWGIVVGGSHNDEIDRRGGEFTRGWGQGCRWNSAG